MNGTELMVVGVNGAALIGFWVWARSNVARNAAAVAKLEAEVEAIKATCAERRGWLENISKAVHVTARNVVRLAQAQGVETLEPPE